MWANDVLVLREVQMLLIQPWWRESVDFSSPSFGCDCLVCWGRIAEAAIRSRCTVLFSEDVSHGRRIAGLEVVNPLRG
jgi:predicted nucleic acid-binding protein